MNDEPAPPRSRVHPLDLLVLVLAVGAAAIAYTFLFRQSPVPRPVDPLLGAEIDLTWTADHDWQERFPDDSSTVLIEEYLTAEVLEQTSAPPAQPRLRVRVLGRDEQRPEAMTLFRTGILRGTLVRLTTRDSEVQAEVLAVRSAAESP